jgi:hypothetical protein
MIRDVLSIRQQKGGNAMKKLFAVMALALVASSAFAQVTLPGNKRGDLPDVPDLVRNEFNIEVLQVGPCEQPFPKAGDLPPGITTAGFCLQGPLGGTSPVTVSTIPACRFVGNVLCLDPGPLGTFESFQSGCPAGTVPVIQGVKLRKIEPLVAKCPDVFPGVDFTQTGVSGIRTWWPIKFTPCDTIFRLDIEVGCVGPVTKGSNRTGVVEVHQNRFNFKVTVRPETFRWVIEALHCEPLGVCEVPCITDEAFFARLLIQADEIARLAGLAFGPSGTTPRDFQALRDLNDILDRTESLIVKFCFFTLSAFDVNEKDGTLIPCALFNGVLPGNKTIGPFGFGIIDTVENPCCCKLIGDIACIKRNLIGIDP